MVSARKKVTAHYYLVLLKLQTSFCRKILLFKNRFSAEILPNKCAIPIPAAA